jgi:hypothetical protein
MKISTKAGLIAAVLLMATGALSNAQASADLIKVYSPIVEEGELEFELRGHGSFARPSSNADIQAHRFEISYGVNSWWATGLFGEMQQNPGSGLRYGVTGFENIFQLTPQGKYWADLGLYLEYNRGARKDDTDEFEVKFLFEKQIQPFILTANLVFAKETGRSASTGVSFEYTAVAKTPVTRGIDLGVQVLGELGKLGHFDAFPRQQFAVGPVLSGITRIGNLPGKLKYEIGYLFGAGASARGLPKYIIEYELPF